MAHISGCASRTQALDGVGTPFHLCSTPLADKHPARCSVGLPGVTPLFRDMYASDRLAETWLEADLRGVREILINPRLANPAGGG